jgi:small subunit ribosomal protein S2
MAITVSLKKLLETGAHFGHQARRWNPKMKDHIYGQQDGVHIFDLTKTKDKLEEALKVLREAAKAGKKILFLGTKKQAKEKVKEVAQKTDSFFVTERWLGGTFTNFEQIARSIKKLEDMKKKMAEGEYDSYTKKEKLLLEREIARLERFFGGISEMQEIPDVLVVVDVKREIGAAKEARKKGVEVIGIVDTNADPDLADYPIPMNDDATKAIEYVLSLMEKAILEGKSKSKAKSKSKSKAKSKDKK